MSAAVEAELPKFFEFIRNGMNVKQSKDGNGLPITRIETISNGEVDEYRFGYAGLKKPDVEKWLLKRGDILFSHINSVEHIGKCALFDLDLDVVHGMNLLCLRPNAERVEPRYIRWLFRSSQFRAQILPFVNKAVNQASISIGNLSSIRVKMPALNEQKRIAGILDQADELRRKRQRTLDRLNQLGQAIFHEMFGDPATNPMQWPIGSIDDLTESTQYGTSSKAGSSGEYAILRMGNISYTGDMDFTDLKFIDFPKNHVEKYTIKSGDILFNRTNSPDLVGKTAVYHGDEPMGFAGYLVRLRLNSKAVPEYVSAYLNSSYGKAVLRGMCKAIIGMANINAKELRGITIPIPPVELQREFQIRVQAARAGRKALFAHKQHLNDLFQSLQHQAFQGEL